MPTFNNGEPLSLVREKINNAIVTIESFTSNGGGTDLAYTPASRVLTSSTGTDVTLPLVSSDAGLMSAADKTKLDGITVTGTNTGDQTSIVGITGTKTEFNAAITDGDILYVGDITGNAAHTGEVTGSTILTIDKTAITGKTLVTAASGDHILVADASDTDNLKRVTAQSIADLASGGATNLTYTASTRLLESSTGTDVTLPLVSFDPGLMSAADKTKLDAISGTNTGDQTSIVGITGTKAQFSAAVTDGDILYVGDVTSNATHTGDVTGSTALTIANDAVTLSKMANVAQDTVFYRKTVGTGDPEVQTLAILKTDLGLTGTNSGDQTTIAGITGTKAQFDTAVTDGNFLYVGDAPTSHTHTASDITDFSAAVAATASVTANTAKVSNATHTGDATGSTALTVVKIQGKDFPTLSGADDQKYPKYVSGSNAFVMTTIAGGGDVTGDDTSTTVQNIVAYSTTGGKNITELTGTQGDVLYHNGTNWAKLGAGTLGQHLITNGTGANPAWGYGAVIHSSKSAGVTTTAANTTPVSVSGAVFTYAANAVYQIWVMGRLNSAAATTGAGIQFDLSSAVTAIDVQFIHQLASAGTQTGGHSIADDTSVGVSSGVPAGPLDVPLTAWGLLVTGANTGTCQLRLRSETTAVTELLAGTVMVVTRVA